MSKLVREISLTFCMFAVAEATPPEPSVSVQCCGRLRHGVVAIGGETTGTTITFNRIVWEVQLHDGAERDFANEHNKETVVVTGTLRRIAGVETKVRWIIDVNKLSERDATTDREGTQMTIQGTLRATDPGKGATHEMTIDSDGQVWPIDLSSNATLKAMAASLIDQPVLLTGSLEHFDKPDRANDEESIAPVIIRVKTLKRSAETRLQD